MKTNTLVLKFTLPTLSGFGGIPAGAGRVNTHVFLSTESGPFSISYNFPIHYHMMLLISRSILEIFTFILISTYALSHSILGCSLLSGLDQIARSCCDAQKRCLRRCVLVSVLSFSSL